MECQDARLLLAFSERRIEAVDAGASAAIVQHLSVCPDCAAFAQAERAADEALGQAMRDVAAPAELKAKILRRLAAGNRRAKWPWFAAAAAVLLVSLGLIWHCHWSRPLVTMDDVIEHASRGVWDKDKVAQFFAEQGVDAELPTEFDYQYLQSADVSEFSGRRVARLTFCCLDDPPAMAIVYILSRQQFRLDDLQAVDVPGTMAIWPREQYVFVIYHRGQLRPLTLKGA